MWQIVTPPGALVLQPGGKGRLPITRHPTSASHSFEIDQHTDRSGTFQGDKGKLPITRHPTSLAARHIPKATDKAAEADGETVYTNPLLMGCSSSEKAPEPPSDGNRPSRPELATVPGAVLSLIQYIPY